MRFSQKKCDKMRDIFRNHRPDLDERGTRYGSRAKVSESSSERSWKIYLAEIDWAQDFEKVLLSRESFNELMFYMFLEICAR